jgi:hypothetical protein
MALSFTQTKLGAPFEALAGGDSEQDPSYWAGIALGCLPEHVIASILAAGSVPPHLVGSSAGGYHQRFQLLNFEPDPHTLIHFGQQGRFEFQLTGPTGSAFELTASIPCQFTLASGVSQSESQILEAANAAIANYWLTWPAGRVALLSRNDATTITLTIKVVKASEGDPFMWNFKVFPDSAETVDHYEFVWNADFSWALRETYSFRPREDQVAKAGRGPHEIGHMMGIPHDFGDRYSVMSDVDFQGFNHWRYSLGGDSNPVLRPYASHFKLFKAWAETVFAQMGRIEDFVIGIPQG